MDDPWQEFLSRLDGYQAPSQEEMKSAYGSPENISQVYIQDMVRRTGAERLLSAAYLNRLLGNAMRPYMGYQVEAGARGEVNPGNYGDYMKRWMRSSPLGYGPGGVDAYKGQVQRLLDELQGAGRGSPLWRAWIGSAEEGPSENLLHALLEGLQQGPFRSNLASRMINEYNLARLPARQGEVWVDYVLGAMPDLGYKWQPVGRPRAPGR